MRALRQGLGAHPAEGAEDVGLRLEEVLVEVVVALAAAAEGEFAAEQRDVRDPAGQLVSSHGGHYLDGIGGRQIRQIPHPYRFQNRRPFLPATEPMVRNIGCKGEYKALEVEKL